MVRYDRDNAKYSVAGKIIRLIAISGLATDKAAYLIDGYSNEVIRRRIYTLQHYGLIKRKHGYMQLKNLKKTYPEIEPYVDDIPKETVEWGLQRAKTASNPSDKQRLGNNSEIACHIINLNEEIFTRTSEIKERGYVSSINIKKEFQINDLARTRAKGMLIDRTYNMSFVFYYINERDLKIYEMGIENRYKSLSKTKQMFNVFVMNKIEKIYNLFELEVNEKKKGSRARKITLDKIRGEKTLIFPNIKTTHNLMRFYFLPGMVNVINRLYPKNHNKMSEVDLIDGNNATFYFLYPDLHRLRRIYLIMQGDKYESYNIITLIDYKDMIEGIKERLGIEIGTTYITLDEIENKIIGRQDT